MAYSIVYWLYDNLDADDFVNYQTLKDKLEELDQDGKIKGWMDNDDWVHRAFSGSKGLPSREPLQTKIDDWNNDYLSTQISKASSVEELNALKKSDNFDNIEDAGIFNSLISDIDAKIGELTKGDVDKLIEDVNKSNSFDEVDKMMDQVQKVRREYGQNSADKYEEAISRKVESFGSLADAFASSLASRIDRAGSVDEINSLLGELRDAPTDESNSTYNIVRDAADRARRSIQ